MEGGRVTAKSMQSREPTHREGEDDEEARKKREWKRKRRGRKGREAELLETAQKGLACRAMEIARDMHISIGETATLSRFDIIRYSPWIIIIISQCATLKLSAAWSTVVSIHSCSCCSCSCSWIFPVGS